MLKLNLDEEILIPVGYQLRIRSPFDPECDKIIIHAPTFVCLELIRDVEPDENVIGTYLSSTTIN